MRLLEKLFIFFCLLFILHSSMLNAQTGWFQQQSGTTSYLRDVFFVNAQTGWIVTDSAKILMTSNGGLNWSTQQIYTNPFPNFYTINFANDLTRYIGGGVSTSMGFGLKYLFKTTNSGANWYVINSEYNGVEFFCFSSIAIINPETIFAASSGQYSLGGSIGDIRKSTNGGTNFLSGFGYGAHTSVTFINEQTGWTVSNYFDDVGTRKKYILKTTNSGLNWSIQFKDTVTQLSLSKIIFLNENTGYAIGRGNSPIQTKFFKTTNGGANWNILTFNNRDKGYSMCFLNVNTGWICGSWWGDSASISRTSDGGETWTSQRPDFLLYPNLNSIYFVNSLTGYAVGSSGIILKTTTGGITFVKQISQIIPSEYKLFQNYPNPFNPVTKIKFDIAPLLRGAGGVLTSIKIYDILGKENQTLVNEQLQPGTYEVTFDGSNIPSGIYFYKLEIENYIETKKMLMVK